MCGSFSLHPLLLDGFQALEKTLNLLFKTITSFGRPIKRLILGNFDPCLDAAGSGARKTSDQWWNDR